MDSMSDLTVAMLGSYPPRECGIATFTRHLHDALIAHGASLGGVVAVDEPGARRRYSSDVRWRLQQDNPASYRRLASALRDASVDLLCIQHEYGLFGGLDGELLISLMDSLRIPVVTTLHTLLSAPTPHMRAVTQSLCDRSAAVVVLARCAIPLLRDVYGVDPRKVSCIPHGVPTVPRAAGMRRRAKAQLGQTGVTLLSTFGLIGPTKGIEYVIRALPQVVREHPEVRYLILGETHPGERRCAGEDYRTSLEGLVAELGLDEHVGFEARYLDQDELVQWLLATDIYLMPYLDPEQIVSGTLSYAVGCGKAVISTGSRYARELLAEGRGEIVPFRDPDAISGQLLRLLGDRLALAAMEHRAYAVGRQMRWPTVAGSYHSVFNGVAGSPRSRSA
ncbi:MAG: glycosyltransferase family 4 protein [Egibacteraceae bacterium]